MATCVGTRPRCHSQCNKVARGWVKHSPPLQHLLQFQQASETHWRHAGSKRQAVRGCVPVKGVLLSRPVLQPCKLAYAQSHPPRNRVDMRSDGIQAPAQRMGAMARVRALWQRIVSD